MKVCVDTTILIDILKDEFHGYQEKFYLAYSKKEQLIAPTVVYAELMPQFSGNTDLLNTFLHDHKISIKPLGIASATEAARRWMKYLKKKSKKRCHHCKKVLEFKEHFLSDFYIGGFAISQCDSILTRDRGIFKKYFPELKGYDSCLS